MKHDTEKIIKFLDTIRVAIGNPSAMAASHQDLCKHYKIGAGSSMYALEKGDWIKRDGRGWRHWRWTGDSTVYHADADRFVELMAEYSAQINRKKPEPRFVGLMDEHLAQINSKKPEPQPENIPVSRKPGRAVKDQAPLFMDPAANLKYFKSIHRDVLALTEKLEKMAIIFSGESA